MKTLYIFLGFLLLYFVSAGQTVTVYDRSDLQPVSDASIANRNKSFMVTTDRKGNADLSPFAATDTLIISHVAYQPLTVIKSTLKAGANKLYLTDNVIRLEEFVLSANRTAERRSDIPYVMEVIPAKVISFNNPQTSAIMLEQTGSVFVQQSQLGGGSPVIRGFEANRVLLVLDGVRMNNAIYRAGHLQSAITVDPSMLSSTEILFGPGSTLYGSDALGGVISFRTRDPLLSDGEKALVNGNVMARFSSANLEKTGGVTLNLGFRKWGVLAAFSYNDFEDLRMGREQNPFYEGFGDRNYYADRIDGIDTMIANDKPWIQRPSGYSQLNALAKVLWVPSHDLRLTLNVQYTTSSDIPRYDRLTEMDDASGEPKYAEWYYGPQERLFASVKADLLGENAVFDRGSVILAFQKVSEDRINRRFGKDMKKYNLDRDDVFSLNADFVKKLHEKDELRYGVEFVYNNVKSQAYQEEITSGEVYYDIATRYPDDKGIMFTAAAYLSNVWKINPKLAFSQGLRYNYVILETAYSDTMLSIMKFPFGNTIGQRNGALNGYLGLVYTPGHDWKLSLVGSTGFRAPNIDDIGKLNDSNSKDQMIVVPNPDLQPELAYNAEIAVGKTFLERIRLEASGFYTWLTQAIVMSPSTYNGQDSIIYDGEICQVQTNTNAGDAYVYGMQGSLLAQITQAFSISSNLTWTAGRVVDPDEPLDHIPPVYGMTSFRLELRKFKGDLYFMYNGWKKIKDYSPGGEDNEAYATEYGMPAWYTVNLKLSYQVNSFLNIEAGCENILDQNYRKFASGISSPGRNFILSLRGNF